MEVKVVCDCGQKYKFDVEPVKGQMPVKVNCPVCGTDGTAAANGILSRMVSGEQPVSVAPVLQPPVALPPAPSAGLRVDQLAPVPAAVDPPPPIHSAPSVVTGMRPAASVARKPRAAEKFSLGMGILGAVLGAALGAALMYGFFLWADFRFPLMGTCIGVFTGLGARMLAKGTDTTLGGVAGAIAFASTGGTLYLMFGDVSGLFIISMIVSISFAYKLAG
ncbi:MAG TPA: hypothetical protein VMA13_11580 [Candidatus Saccharimonadales bacterium]|nr:hypothetical protein [Candidatus Saccharimonadales bacterium]